MKTIGVADYTNQTSFKHFRGKMSKFDTSQKLENIHEMCTK